MKPKIGDIIKSKRNETIFTEKIVSITKNHYDGMHYKVRVLASEDDGQDEKIRLSEPSIYFTWANEIIEILNEEQIKNLENKIAALKALEL